MIEILPYDLTEMRRRSVMLVIHAVVFVQEHSLSVLVVHLTKRWRKYHLSDVAGECTDQSVGHQ